MPRKAVARVCWTVATVKFPPAVGVDFHDFPGCISAGDSYTAVVANGHEALTMHVNLMQDYDDAIPLPSTGTEVANHEDLEPGEVLVEFKVRVRT